MIFYKEKDVINWVKQNYTKDNLAQVDTHINAPIELVLYKGNGYDDINLRLRKNPESIDLHEDLHRLQKLIGKYTIPTDITVYRYVSFKEDLWLNMSTKWRKICRYKGFLSTTLLKERYRELHQEVYRRTLIEIEVPQGVKGVYLPEVNPDMPEFEILFPHGTMLKRVGINKYKVIAGE